MNITQEIKKIIVDKTIWTQKTFPAQTILLHQGGEITHSYYLKEGIIKVYSDEKGENVIINLLADERLLPFDNFTNKTSFVNMKTLEKTVLYAISDADYRQLRKNNPLFDEIVKQGLYDMMDTMVYRTLVLSGKGVAARYKTALEYYPCVRRMSDIEVAKFINSTSKRFGEIKDDVLKEFDKNKRNKDRNEHISNSK